MEKSKLPALKDLYNGDLPLKKAQSDLNILVNQQPKKEWIREHPFAKGVKYIPIERIEFLLTAIFINWWVEVKTIQTIANSVVVTVRLHYQNVTDNAWSCQDGIGAAPIATDKGAGAMEWDKVKNDSVMKAAPAAESYAVKDAAEKIGKLFGKDLNRKYEFIYDSIAGLIPEENKITVAQIGYADELIRKSTFDDETKERLRDELSRTDLTGSELTAIINTLKENQFKSY
jgi:hypothetical protein